jgi:hypothetical protein
MPFQGFTINGCVIDCRTERGVPGLDVQLWAASPQGNVCLKEAATGEDGTFRMSLSDADLRRLTGRSITAVAFRVHREDRLIHTETFRPSDIPFDAAEWEVEIWVSLPEEPAPGPPPGEPDEFVVRGRVLWPDGSAVADATVQAFDRGLPKKDHPLGTATTDGQGQYCITYAPEQLRERNKTRADLIVRGYDQAGELLAESPLILDAPPDQIVELVSRRPQAPEPAEYARLGRVLAPLLQDVDVVTLAADDVAYLAEKTGLDPLRVAHFVRSAQLGAGSNIPAEVFYGLLRQGLPTSLPALLAQGRAAHRTALAAAIADNIVGAAIQDTLDEIVGKLRSQTIQEALTRRVLPDAGTLGELLTLASVPAEKQQTFLNAYIDREGSLHEFWTEQKKPNNLGQARTAAVQRTLQLGAVTQNHLPLIKALEGKGYKSLRELAGLHKEQWQELIASQVDGKPVGIPKHVEGPDAEERYIETTMRILEGTHPTAVLAREIKADAEAGNGISHAQGVVAFLDQHPDCDFRDVPIDLYLARNEKALEGIDNPQEVRSQLQAVYRLFNITPPMDKYRFLRPLVGEGLTSAYDITQMGRPEFIACHADWDAETAGEIFDNAAQINALALVLFAQYGAALNSISMYAMEGVDVSDVEGKGIPELETLFGSLDMCECEHCRSAYSPAAYLVDILHFLDGIDALEPGRTVLDVLLDRRPDLGCIELNCENTDTVLPYVDLVNEVLENAATRFTLSADGLVADLDAEGEPSAELIQKFVDNQINLSPNARVLADSEGRRWRLIDPGQDGNGAQDYVILKEDNRLNVYVLSQYQTRATPDELSARPEHLNPQAYVRLARSSYPWDLPFDLWFEEARTYIEHLGFDRYAWMEKLPGKRDEAQLSDKVARDYLGLTDREWVLIPKKDGVTEQEEAQLWGVQALDDLGCVEKLLERAGFDHDDPEGGYKFLRQLRSTRFLTANGAIEVGFPTSAPCDLEGARLVDSNGDPLASPDLLSLLHGMRRFMRLQRRLGWTIPELDKALTAFGATELDGKLLRQLSDVERLRAELGVPLLEMLSWWGLIDTAEDRSEQVESEKARSLYEQVFLDLSVDNPASALFELDESRSQLEQASKKYEITDHEATLDDGSKIDVTAAVAGALEISAEDLMRLVIRDDQDGGIVSDELNLENLSELYRNVSLARALELSIKDLISARALVGIDPFRDTVDPPGVVKVARTAKARRFVERVQEIQAAAFSIAELDYLLRHNYEQATDHFVPTDGEIAAILARIAAGLAQIAAEAAAVPDPEGARTGERLALLLGPDDAELVVQTLADRGIYREPLDSLPDGVQFPGSLNEQDPLRERVSYDKGKHSFQVKGILSSAEKGKLNRLDPSNDKDYEEALQSVTDQPRKLLKEKSAAIPGLWAALWPLLKTGARPEDRFATVLEEVNGYLVQMQSQDLVGQELAAALQLEADLTTLLVHKLIKGQDEGTQTAFDDFAHLAEAGLSRRPVDGQVHHEGMVQAAGSGTYAFRAELEPAGEVSLWVNDRLLVDPDNTIDNTIDLEAGKFYPLHLEPADSGADAELFWTVPGESEQSLPAGSLLPMTAVRSYRLLHKCALLIRGFDISADELSYLAAHRADFQNLDLNRLPLERQGEASLFPQWWQLHKLFTFRGRYSRATTRVIDILAAAYESVTAAKDQLRALTDWEEQDLDDLAGEDGFNLKQKDFQQGARFEDLYEAMNLLKRSGISARQLIDWVGVDLGASFDKLEDDAWKNKAAMVEALKQAVKAKYDRARWLEVARPLRDELREKQRAALTAHLVHRYGLEDANDLYARFLVDVEMSPCMMTSRIKQALSSAQLFVQRCFMNLEKDEVQLAPHHAQRWAWMKNYRVWEANRKVFLYPENWIEPELRLEKSPFFAELENELLQGEVTDETVEAAYLRYLEKLDEVARLEVAGLYCDEEADVVHVFGRTRGLPHVYYYRCWVDQAYWTPWERVDLDIEGDHLIPVVFNRRPYLFWPIFQEKADEEQDLDENNPQPPKKHYEIRLAWSEYKDGKWSAKRMSDVFVKGYFVEWEGKDIYRFRVAELETCLHVVPQLVYFYRDPILGTGSQWAESTRVFRFGADSQISVVAPEPEEGLHTEATFEQIGYVYHTRSRNMGLVPQAAGKLKILAKGEGVKHIAMFGPENDRETALEQLRDEGIPTRGYFRTSEGFPTYREWYYEPEPWGDAVLEGYTLSDPEFLDVLDRPPRQFYVLLPHQYRPYISQAPFFFEDEARTFFVTTEKEIDYVEWIRSPDQIDLGYMDMMPEAFYALMPSGDAATGGGDGAGMNPHPVGVVPIWTAGSGARAGLSFEQERSADRLLGESGIVTCKYTFHPFFHSYVNLLIKQLNRHGIPGLLDPDPDVEEPGDYRTQVEYLQRQQNEDEYFDDYDPQSCVVAPHPEDEIDFSYGGAYSLYNWELFFHAPFLIANRLSDNQRFEEAQKWYHYIFDPTDVSTQDDAPQRFWKIKPFYNYDPIAELGILFSPEGTPEQEQLLAQLEDQVTEWQEKPFQPHVVARLRTVAYQKAIVIKYIQNLLAWGDYHFRRFTIEDINEATQLYVLAAEILGQRPRDLPAPQGPRTIEDKDGNPQEVRDFYDLDGNLGRLSNALVDLESTIYPSADGSRPDEPVDISSLIDPTFFFCIPRNTYLLDYWNTVADRLFKIRHCMTIEGVVRQLPLFQPPIEPGLLVRAAAAGVDIGSVLSDLYAPLPHYRFQVMAQKAAELCNDVKALGAALLSALEKKDAEELALLRSGHEIRLLEAVRDVRKKQIEEADEALKGLGKARELAEIRHEYYKNLEFMNASEKAHLDLLMMAALVQYVGQLMEMAASNIQLVPDTHVGGAGWCCTPYAVSHVGGGAKAAAALQAYGRAMGIYASLLNTGATMSSILGGYERRWDEWKLQEKLAEKEIEQLEKQIIAAEIRLAIAEAELQNHDKQVENAKAVDTFMRDKFTNAQLYGWMVSQISTIYFQSYQMAYELARRAERAFQHEIGDPQASFIEFGYWDSLKKGLLAGERLGYDLKRMEVAYLDQNKREYELTKHISLAMLDPYALIELKQKGMCEVELPEWLFDLDYPGHYMRRIRSVGLTIPCVTGPYTSVNCTLTLLWSSVRTDPAASSGYARLEDGNDGRFRDTFGAVQSIATSSGQNDSGLFELNFHDERYLPFEGAGANSRWRLELPQDFRQLDYDTISDVVLHLRYTAREGGTTLKDAAIANLRTSFAPEGVKLERLFSLRHEFPNQWHRFLHDEPDYELEFEIRAEYFPFVAQDKTIQIQSVSLFVHPKPKLETDTVLTFILTSDGTEPSFEPPYEEVGTLLHQQQDFGVSLDAERRQMTWKLTMTAIPDELKIDGTDRLDPDAIEDIGIVCHYSITG